MGLLFDRRLGTVSAGAPGVTEERKTSYGSTKKLGEKHHRNQESGWWWFQIFFVSTPNLGEMIQLDGCIFFKRVGEKPPTRNFKFFIGNDTFLSRNKAWPYFSGIINHHHPLLIPKNKTGYFLWGWQPRGVEPTP